MGGMLFFVLLFCKPSYRDLSIRHIMGICIFRRINAMLFLFTRGKISSQYVFWENTYFANFLQLTQGLFHLLKKKKLKGYFVFGCDSALVNK